MTDRPILCTPPAFPEYEPDALFRCRSNPNHGRFRRDRLPAYRGHLYCPRCGRGQFSDLEFVGRESDRKSRNIDQMEDENHG